MYSKTVLYIGGLFLTASGLWLIILSELNHNSSLFNNGADHHWFGENIPHPSWSQWLHHINFTHNYMFGQRRFGDRLLFMDHAWQLGKFLKVVSSDVYYPLPSQTTKGEIITYIRIMDQKTDGTGGTANIMSGGVGFPFVYIHLSSKRSCGFDFLIEVYGS
ncbi:putative salivary secreted peptide [Lycorma delicatula]|uniref:putative salivary secreted peptide n=1 Tax=Lycorma delicatula TaxID=130591 RepID=UPI003F511472